MRGAPASLPFLLVLGLASPGCKKDEPKPAPTSTTADTTTRIAEPAATFTKKKPAVGARREETSDVSMRVALTVDPLGTGTARKAEMNVSETTKRTEEVLAVSGDAVTKVKVTFDSVDAKSVEGGKERKKPSPVLGKTYLVEAKDGRIVVSDDKGRPAPPAEAKEIEKHYQGLGKPDPLVAALPATVAPGEKVDALSKAISERMKEDGDGMSASDVSVTFREKQGDEGVFDVAMKLSKEEGLMSMTMDMKGETRISTQTGWPTAMVLEGPILIGGAKARRKEAADGSGSMSMKMTAKTL